VDVSTNSVQRSERRADIPGLPYRAAVHFLTAVGKISSDIRHEFILLSDVLGLSALVDAMNHPVVAPATEGTVLGPFFTEDAHELAAGESIASEGKGEYMWCEGRILDIDGKPVPHCKIETWETDDEGLWVQQSEERGRQLLMPCCTSADTTHSTRGGQWQTAADG
jgi:protocatechuate 3,4-dioxygenase beta subunit